MVQRCPQVNRVHQGRSRSVFPVQPVQLFACKREGCYPVFIEADAGEGPASGQHEGT